MPTTDKYAIVIEDNLMNRDVMILALNNMGVHCTIIDLPVSIPAFLDPLEQIDVIFLDLELPSQSGFDLLREIKQIDRLKNVPVVAYTVHTSEIGTARSAGFDSFLGKPINAYKFTSQVQRILSGQQVWETT
jgi:CheY-like chemotaxis protein